MVEVIKKIAIDGIAYDVAGGGSTPAGEIDAKDVSFTAEMSSLVSDNVADALEEIAENSTLESLTDTSIQTPEQGEVVMFDSTTNKWHNTPLTTLNEGEPTVDGEYVGQMYKNTNVTNDNIYMWDGEKWILQSFDRTEVIHVISEPGTADSPLSVQDCNKILQLVKDGKSFIVDIVSDSFQHKYYELYKATGGDGQVSLQNISFNVDNDVDDDRKYIYSPSTLIRHRIFINHNNYTFESTFEQIKRYNTATVIQHSGVPTTYGCDTLGTIYVDDSTYKAYIWTGLAWKEL